MRSAFVLSLFLMTACGSRQVADDSAKEPGTSAETSAEPTAPRPALRALLHLGLDLEPSTEGARQTTAFLVMTDETGANQRSDLGVHEGACTDFTAKARGADASVLLAFWCSPDPGQRGSLVYLKRRGSQVVVLRAWLDGGQPSFEDFDQIGVHILPGGVPVSTDYDNAAK